MFMYNILIRVRAKNSHHNFVHVFIQFMKQKLITLHYFIIVDKILAVMTR